MSCRNLLGLLDRRSTFLDGLETESEIPCIDPSGGGWFGRVAGQSPLTGYEPNNLIEISSQYTPMNFPFRRHSFHKDIKDVPTISASAATDTWIRPAKELVCSVSVCDSHVMRALTRSDDLELSTLKL